MAFSQTLLHSENRNVYSDLLPGVPRLPSKYSCLLLHVGFITPSTPFSFILQAEKLPLLCLCYPEDLLLALPTWARCSARPPRLPSNVTRVPDVLPCQARGKSLWSSGSFRFWYAAFQCSEPWFFNPYLWFTENTTFPFHQGYKNSCVCTLQLRISSLFFQPHVLIATVDQGLYEMPTNP